MVKELPESAAHAVAPSHTHTHSISLQQALITLSKTLKVYGRVFVGRFSAQV